MTKMHKTMNTTILYKNLSDAMLIAQSCLL